MTTPRRALCGWGAAVLLGAGPALAGPRTQSLFVIARSKNTNLLHYDVSLNDGKLDLDEPMVAYWVMRAEDGRREGLTWVEREFAYGFRVVSSVTNEGFRVLLKAFARRELAVRRADDGRYRAHVRIAGETAALERIFVSTDEGGVTPSVRFVDLMGIGASGKRVTQRLRP